MAYRHYNILKSRRCSNQRDFFSHYMWRSATKTNRSPCFGATNGKSLSAVGDCREVSVRRGGVADEVLGVGP